MKIDFEILNYFIYISLLFSCGVYITLLNKSHFMNLIGVVISALASVLLFTIAGKFYVGNIEGILISFILMILVNIVLMIGLGLIVRKEMGEKDVERHF